MTKEGLAPDRPTRARPLVGRQVRYWRRERALTLTQVAAKSRLNVGYLSQVENDKASPSLETLAALGSALDVPITWFLIDATPPPRVVRAGDRRAVTGPRGARIEEVDDGVSRDLRIQKFVLPPGHSSGVQARTGEEHVVLLTGRLRCSQGEHTVELGPGDYVVWDAAVWHETVCVGDEWCAGFIITHRPHAAGSVRAEENRRTTAD
jgi:transcriptional regulator with XRE-family HTH domain